MEYLIIAIGVLLTGSILTLFVKEELKIKICSLFTIIGLITALFPAGFVLKTGKFLNSYIEMPTLFGNIFIQIDALSALFIAIISIMGILTSIYAIGYIKPYLNKGFCISSHCFFLMTLLASMLAVVTINHGLYFLIAWEIMSLSSFFLVIFEGNKKEVLKSGIKYLVYMHLSVIFIIAMIAILLNQTNSFYFNDFAKFLTNNTHYANIIFILGFIGFGIKAGFVPFHNWLPDAHPAAPTHVSALMSAVMIKTGIYGILRIILLINIPSKLLAFSVLLISIITALYGILYAISQNDLKRLFAYSSIENIGIIGIGISTGMFDTT